jgi:hypothetical protein
MFWMHEARLHEYLRLELKRGTSRRGEAFKHTDRLFRNRRVRFRPFFDRHQHAHLRRIWIIVLLFARRAARLANAAG